jgi:biopolymer transport protein ExbD
MLELERRSKRSHEISMIPLINVVFLLLIYFLIVGTIEKFELINVDVPSAESGEAIEDGELTILLGRYDEIVIDDDLVDISQFEALVREKIQPNKNMVITLKADARLQATKLIAVINKIKAAGGINLSVVTEQAS